MTGRQRDVNPLIISGIFLVKENMDKRGACHNFKRVGVLQILWLRKMCRKRKKKINLLQGSAFNSETHINLRVKQNASPNKWKLLLS